MIWEIKRVKVRTVVFCGRMVYIIRYYYYFVLFLFYLFTSTDNFSPTNRSMQRLYTTIPLQISNDPSPLMLFFVCNSLHTFSALLLHTRSVCYTSLSYYWNIFFSRLSQLLTTYFPFLDFFDIRGNILQFICAVCVVTFSDIDIKYEIFQCRCAMCDVIFSNIDVICKIFQCRYVIKDMIFSDKDVLYKM